MKNLFYMSLVVSLFASANAFAIRETGGSPPAPLAVVIQGHLQNGSFDLQGRQKFLALSAQHVVQDRVIAITQRQEFQYPDRTYLCIEYRNSDDFIAASDEFKQVLAGSSSIEVIQHLGCR